MGSATRVYMYRQDPGLAALVGHGPSINVVRELAAAIVAAGGREILGVVGAAVNDRGIVNVASRLNARDVANTFGGFRPWLGDGLALTARGALGGYNGNLAAQLDGIVVPLLVVSVPDFALKDKSISDATAANQLLAITRSATAGILRVPAGTRFTKTGSGETYTVATLEDVTFLDGEGTGGTTVYHRVRVRQTSTPAVASGPAVVALDTLNTLVDAIPGIPSGVTVTVHAASSSTITLDMTPAEVALRYAKALDTFTATIEGGSAYVMVTDRTEAVIANALSVHCVAETTRGYSRICVTAPPVGTTAALGQGSDASGGVARAGFERERAVYTRPAMQRTFLADADNLLAPNYRATMPAAVLYGARIVNGPPHANPSTPLSPSVFAGVSFAGVEPLAPAPDPVDDWDVGIDSLLMDQDPETGALDGAWFAGILANKDKIANVRFEDAITRQSIRIVRPYHKAPATQANQDAAAGALWDYYDGLVKAGTVRNFVIALEWDGDLEMLTISVAIRTAGNMDILTFRTRIGPGVDIQQAA